MACGENLLKFQLLGDRAHVTELSGPLHATNWALPHWLLKAGFGDQIWEWGPPKSKFRIFDLVTTCCTLAYIFSYILIEDIMAHDV